LIPLHLAIAVEVQAVVPWAGSKGVDLLTEAAVVAGAAVKSIPQGEVVLGGVSTSVVMSTWWPVEEEESYWWRVWEEETLQ
jgi:uncharacterized membrane protein (DUF441 family)